MAKTILAVDDEDEILDQLKEVLEDQNYQVVTACNGEDGLEKSSKLNPDLIILDISMPKMDGLEMLSRLRRDQKTSETPVIMLSGYGRTDHLLEAERFKASEFLIKPFNLDEFLRIVQHKIRK